MGCWGCGVTVVAEVGIPGDLSRVDTKGDGQVSMKETYYLVGQT